jgi:CPA2 family monovalent cation:H+ antiporter-2
MEHDFSLLIDIIVVLGVSVLVVFLCQILRIPALVGFLLSGVLAGPSLLGLISDSAQVSALAEIGVVLLLFTIGMELSIGSLWQAKRTILLGGSIQVFGTIAVVIAIGSYAGYEIESSLFFGFLVCLSSTAIVFKLLQDKKVIDSPHGRASTSIAIFQDIMIVPMMLVTSLLAGTSEASASSLLILVVKIVLILVMLGVLARWVVPWLLHHIARTRLRELFLLSVIILCFLITWLTSSVGLSLALGAFAAGLVISESPYSEQALGLVLSLRDVFVSFFFVTIGMLIDVSFAVENILSLLVLALLVVFLKGAIATFAIRLTGNTLRTALWTGVYLSQVGEFAFVLSAVGLAGGLLNEHSYQIFLSVSLLSMISTPILIAVFPKVFKRLRPERDTKKSHEKSDSAAYSDHLMIIGFGVNGRNLARACKAANISYVILEVNPDVVKEETEKGEPILFGDAATEAVLEKAGVERARIAVVAISDPPSTRRTIKLIKQLNPSVQVIARTRYINEMQVLFERGADEVIPEEFETSVEILNRVLHAYLIPQSEIEKFIDEVRADGYSMFRSLQPTGETHADLRQFMPHVEIDSYRVAQDAPIDGKTFAEVELRSKYGATALAVRRGTQTFANPEPEMQLKTGDVVIVMAKQEHAQQISALFRGMEIE